MSRSIDADRLLSDKMKQKYYHLPNGDTAIPIIDIEHAPTIDAVPVVRCKDCKNWIPGIITEKDDFIPPKCGKYQQMVGHNCFDFCSLAERVETNGQV